MDRAMSRIEAALVRIEHSARRLPVEPADFVRRRKAMRTRVSAALAELDQLIESLGK